MAGPRLIIQQHKYDEALSTLGLSQMVVDELTESSSFTLARMPEFFPLISNTASRMLTFECIREGNNKKVRIRFSYNDEKVWLEDVYFAVECEEEDQ